MEKKPVEVEFPIGGIVRRFGYQAQPPYTTPYALNIRPESVAQLRYRGGTRPGLSKEFSQLLGSGNKVNFQEYVSWSNSGTLTHQLCSASNGVFYRNVSGTMTQVSTGALGTDHTRGVDIGQKLYIADWSGTGGTVKVFDPSAQTISALTASTGTVPTYCKLIARFRGRLVLAGDKNDPHAWYMSRVGDPTDWNYSVTDDTAVAVSGALNEAYKIGEAVTAIIPSSDMCILFGCTNSLWLMRGDPAFGGQIDQLSYTVGVIDQSAWCKTPENIVVFMSYDGLYMTYGGCDDKARPQSLSRERIPDELLNIDVSTTLVLLEYDTFSRGIHIFLSPRSGNTAATHWYFDWENKGFWQFEIPGTMQPFSIRAARGVGSSQSVVYLGGLDGYIRKFSTSATNDDGTAIESWCDFGPYGAGHGFTQSCVDEIQGTLASGSNRVTWSVREGSGPQDAYNASTVAPEARTGVWDKAGWNYRSFPRIAGSDFYVRVGSETQQWTMERLGLVLSDRGRMRVP